LVYQIRGLSNQGFIKSTIYQRDEKVKKKEGGFQAAIMVTVA
jgi:hypothetical protein